MAIGSGDVRKRLKTACMELIRVSEDDLPEDLRDDWRWIHNQITRFGPVFHSDGTVYAGTLDNALSKIKNTIGAKIAERIFVLERELRSRLNH